MTKRKNTARPISRPKSTTTPAQPDPNEQSGSAGRNTSPENLDPGKDTGQDHYGQSGFSGKGAPETDGQANYRKSASVGGREREVRSNRGSGQKDSTDEDSRARPDADTPKRKAGRPPSGR